jgi:hypothetical protein
MSETPRSEAALVILEQVAQVARQAAEQARQTDTPFGRGLRTAYHDVLTVALEQAALLALDPAEFGLGGFDPESLFDRRDRTA